MRGADFDAEHHAIPEEVFNSCYYGGELNDICISTYVENRARLAVMKSAIDYRLFKETGSDQNEKLAFVFGDKKFEYTLLDALPKSFKAGLDKLATLDTSTGIRSSGSGSFRFSAGLFGWSEKRRSTLYFPRRAASQLKKFPGRCPPMKLSFRGRTVGFARWKQCAYSS